MTLGLLGTFLGLVQAMATLRTESTDIIGVLASLLGGIDQALGSSIVGLMGYTLTTSYSDPKTLFSTVMYSSHSD